MKGGIDVKMTDIPPYFFDKEVKKWKLNIYT